VFAYSPVGRDNYQHYPSCSLARLVKKAKIFLQSELLRRDLEKDDLYGGTGSQYVSLMKAIKMK
jgi:hypothetical protein